MLQDVIKAKVETLRSIIAICEELLKENEDSDAILIKNHCELQLKELKSIVDKLNSTK